MKRLIIPSLILLPLAPAELSTDYAAERSLRIEVETEFTMDTTENVIEVNGEERPGRGGGASEESRRIVMIDKVLEDLPPMPKELRNRWDGYWGYERVYERQKRRGRRGEDGR